MKLFLVKFYCGHDNHWVKVVECESIEIIHTMLKEDYELSDVQIEEEIKPTGEQNILII